MCRICLEVDSVCSVRVISEKAQRERKREMVQ